MLKTYKDFLSDPNYKFLSTNEHLKDNIILVCYGGSHAYGTSLPESDIDCRGIALPSKKDILLRPSFEQICDSNTDTVIYSFDKIISLLSACNPNTIEMLGCKDYLFLAPVGKALIDNADMFLSKRAVYAFGGYANQQLRRLENKSNLVVGINEQEKHLCETIKSASYTFNQKYFDFPEDSIKLYLDASVDDPMLQDIFMDITLKHYPLRDYKCMWAEMHNIVKEYAKIGHRNLNAIEHKKLGKHQMHLVRLYYMCFDILEQGKIITYREKEHDFLMDIRNGKYLDANDQPTKEFMDIVTELENRLEYDKMHCDLPEKPDQQKIDNFVIKVHEEILRS